MHEVKEKSLKDTYQKVLDVALRSIQPINILDEIVAEDVMGYGTTIDEKILSLSDFRNLIKIQREQSEGIEMDWIFVPVHHRLSVDGNVALFANDVSASFTVNNETIKMEMRFTLVFEFQDNKWVLVHFHGSKPENVLSEADTFGIEDWKQKNAELEKIVAQRTLELTKQKEELEHALLDLRNTQAQLIQSEKMASLGELTAGIAHEIQNPLNFVNNFSDVSTELVDEMNEEIAKGNLDDAKEIAGDLKQNLEKINHHGKRAGDIVKGMLQHSRSSSGTKEPTDINALADEYLRLAYHGLRAKDKSFNATMKTEFDETIGNISIIPQDIGRVILNLITNAFYVVNEKKKTGVDEYEPIVTVSTKKINGKLEVSVADNGNGIPQKVLDKIFEPFFTTKPTGQGTGLGLSLSYDIVKAHGGELKVETKEGEGSEFIFQLLI